MITSTATPLTREMLLDAMDRLREQKPTVHGLEEADPHLLYPGGRICVICGWTR